MSAGSRSAVWPAMAKPTDCTWERNCSSVSALEKPGKLSSLSSVPPVWPSPRPDILAMCRPWAATIGSRASEVLSPTPPVECLSALTPVMELKSSVSPEFIMASVRSRVSRRVMPRQTIAISSAEV